MTLSDTAASDIDKIPPKKVKCCENCSHWYTRRNGGRSFDGNRAWAECEAILEGCSEIEITFFGDGWAEHYVLTSSDFYCALWDDDEGKGH